MTATVNKPPTPRPVPPEEILRRIALSGRPYDWLPLLRWSPEALVFGPRSQRSAAAVYRTVLDLATGHARCNCPVWATRACWHCRAAEQAYLVYLYHREEQRRWADGFLREQMVIWNPARTGRPTIQFAAMQAVEAERAEGRAA